MPYDIAESYDVLAIIDQTLLPSAIKVHVAGSVLGRSLDVRMSSNGPVKDSSRESYVVALLKVFLFLPGLQVSVHVTYKVLLL